MENSQEGAGSDGQFEKRMPEAPLITPMRKQAMVQLINVLGKAAAQGLPSVVYSRQARNGVASMRTKLTFADPGTGKDMVVYMFLVATTAEADKEMNFGLACDPRVRPEEVKPESN